MLKNISNVLGQESERHSTEALSHPMDLESQSHTTIEHPTGIYCFFVEPENKTKLLEIMKRYCFEEDGDEKGAIEHLFEIVEIDPNKGSATGYIAKYISKNIDGKDLDEGVYGENPIVAVQRVETWASIWAIRQFQQIWGAQASIWRELRRLEALIETDTVIEKARHATDISDWSGYQEAMGGVICLRKERPY